MPATYGNFLAGRNRADNMIFGQAHPIDVELLITPDLLKMIVTRKMHLAIVPHHLEAENLLALEKGLREKIALAGLGPSLNFCVVTPTMEERMSFDPPLITLVAIKGMLCEFFTQFSVSYIGGGHGRSIHSELEPYMAGCNIICGPKVHRSTEYDYVKAMDRKRIEVARTSQDFFQALAGFLPHQKGDEEACVEENKKNWKAFAQDLEGLC